MSDMSFLDGGDTKIVPPVSTGNKPKSPPVVKIHYDTKIAHLEQEFSVSIETPYVQRSIALVKSLGYSIGLNLRTVLESRAKGEKVVTYREADIMLRSNVNESNHEFLLKSLVQFDSYMTEEDSSFSLNIFGLRARYNKGKAWVKQDIPNRTETQLITGITRLQEIEQELEGMHLSFQPEEKETGFHQEFLKPEYMTWVQFENKMRNLYRTLESKNLSTGNSK